MWATQGYRPEVWIEKDALVGVIEGVCEEFDVPFFSCRGYTSQSEMWAAAMRLKAHMRFESNGGRKSQIPYIFHLGDHDPSGKDMTRDICDRLALFMGGCELKRLALNMDQLRKYNPPPNPAKTTDSRYAGYTADFDDESWELDVLEPRVIAGLIRAAIRQLIDRSAWKVKEQERDEGRRKLGVLYERWDELAGDL